MSEEDDSDSDPEFDIEMGTTEPEVNYITLEDCVGIGWALSYLRWTARYGGPVYLPDGGAIYDILGGLADRLDNSEIDLPIVSEIETQQQDLENAYGPFGDEEIAIQEPEKRIIFEAALSWQRMLRSALEAEERIRIQATSVVDTEQLNDDPATLFSDETVWSSLSRHSQNDLEEACQAVGLGLPTASMSVSLRVVERRLREWHGILKDSDDDEDRTFGQLVSEIEDHFDSNDQDPPEIWYHLKYLKKRRDQVSHPDRIPDIQEAESTLMMVRETLTELHYRIEGPERYEASTEE